MDENDLKPKVMEEEEATCQTVSVSSALGRRRYEPPGILASPPVDGLFLFLFLFGHFLCGISNPKPQRHRNKNRFALKLSRFRICAVPGKLISKVMRRSTNDTRVKSHNKHKVTLIACSAPKLRLKRLKQPTSTAQPALT